MTPACAMPVRDLDPEHGAAALVQLHAELAAGEVHDPVDDCKAKPQALAAELADLGLHEGLEEVVVNEV
jgi:hypothetical protein